MSGNLAHNYNQMEKQLDKYDIFKVLAILNNIFPPDVCLGYLHDFYEDGCKSPSVDKRKKEYREYS